MYRLGAQQCVGARSPDGAKRNPGFRCQHGNESAVGRESYPGLRFAPSGRRAAESKGRGHMALEIKILDYGDIELESSFLVLGRDCGRTRRVPTYGFLVLGGTWPVLV